jgi:hypothetical protein
MVPTHLLLLLLLLIFFQFTKLDAKSTTTSSISSEERGGASLFVLIYRGIYLHLNIQDSLLRMENLLNPKIP